MDRACKLLCCLIYRSKINSSMFDVDWIINIIYFFLRFSDCASYITTYARALRMRSSNKVYIKASIKHANITTPSLLRLFSTAKLTNQSLDAAFVVEQWPTRSSMGPRGYSQINFLTDQPVNRCSLVAIIGGHPKIKVSPAWVVTPVFLLYPLTLHLHHSPSLCPLIICLH